MEIISISVPNMSDMIVGLVKNGVAGSMTEGYDLLLADKIPEKEENQTAEEYKQVLKEYMIDTIEAVGTLKKEIFVNVLDSYNSYLTKKHEIEELIDTEKKKAFDSIDLMQKGKRSSILLGLSFSLLLPGLLPITILLTVTDLGRKEMNIRYTIGRTIQNEELRQRFESIQIPFFDFTCSLREDYHKSNLELKELKQRAEQGENIMPELLQMISPERLSLPRVEDYLLEEKEDNKQLKKV